MLSILTTTHLTLAPYDKSLTPAQKIPHCRPVGIGPPVGGFCGAIKKQERRVRQRRLEKSRASLRCFGRRVTAKNQDVAALDSFAAGHPRKLFARDVTGLIEDDADALQRRFVRRFQCAQCRGSDANETLGLRLDPRRQFGKPVPDGGAFLSDAGGSLFENE
jgi:hypothetical protein